MRVPKVYLETTVFDFYFANDAPDKRQDTLKLFEEIKEGLYAPYTSFVVVDEINRTANDQKRENLSWNFQHIVKQKTRHMVNAISLRENYRTIEICSPKEVIENVSE